MAPAIGLLAKGAQPVARLEPPLLEFLVRVPVRLTHTVRRWACVASGSEAKALLAAGSAVFAVLRHSEAYMD